jgi:hypothetical protein
VRTRRKYFFELVNYDEQALDARLASITGRGQQSRNGARWIRKVVANCLLQTPEGIVSGTDRSEQPATGPKERTAFQLRN